MLFIRRKKWHFAAGQTSLHTLPTGVLSSFLHNCTSTSILWDLKFSAARGNRNICVLTSKVLKLQSVPFCVPYKMISHWLPHGLYSSCWLAYPVLGHLRIISLRTSLENLVNRTYKLSYELHNFSFVRTFLRKVWWIRSQVFISIVDSLVIIVFLALKHDKQKLLLTKARRCDQHGRWCDLLYCM